MQAYLADGLSAAEAARAALEGDTSPDPGGLASRHAAAAAGSEPLAALRRLSTPSTSRPRRPSWTGS